MAKIVLEIHDTNHGIKNRNKQEQVRKLIDQLILDVKEKIILTIKNMEEIKDVNNGC